jgi:GYF domain 2
MSDAWYYAEGDKAVGPVTQADLQEQLSLVSNAKDVLVWRAGFANWQSADSVSDLALPLVPKPPPIPRSMARRIARGLLTFLGYVLAGFAIRLFIEFFMPDTWKKWQETGIFWVPFVSSLVIAQIAVTVPARFLTPKLWESSGKFLLLWLLTVVGFAVILRFL